MKQLAYCSIGFDPDKSMSPPGQRPRSSYLGISARPCLESLGTILITTLIPLPMDSYREYYYEQRVLINSKLL